MSWNRITQYVTFCIWLFSFCITLLCFFYIVEMYQWVTFLLRSSFPLYGYFIICVSILLLIAQFYFEVIYYPHFKEKEVEAQRSEDSEGNPVLLS